MKFFKIRETDHALNIEFLASESSNAFSLEAARELAKISKTKIKKPVIVTSAHPRLFCSGGNLSDYKKLKGKAPGLKINREIQAQLDIFGKWPVPKLAVIDGDVLGGGMEWLARFDFRWSTPVAVFAFWQKRIGLSPGWGGGKAWAAKVGEEKVRQLLIEGRVLSAFEAHRLNLVDRVISGWKINDEAEAWAHSMSDNTTNSLLAWKSAREAAAFGSLWMGPAHAATLKAWKS